MTVSSAFVTSKRTQSFRFSRRRICIEGCGAGPSSYGFAAFGYLHTAVSSFGGRVVKMVQKIIDVAGSSPASFAKAADNAVATAAETVRNLRWARVSELEMELDGKKVKSYRVTVRIYFDLER